NIVGGHPDSLHQQVVRLAYTLPAIIAVHGIITTNGRNDFACTAGDFLLQRIQIAYTRIRVCISSIEKGMYKYLLQAGIAGSLAETHQVVDMRMHAAVGQQADKV